MATTLSFLSLLIVSSERATAFEFCDTQAPSGEIAWDIVDNGTSTIPFSFTAGDAWTPVRNVESVSVRGLHQYAGDLAATMISPSGTEVILFRLGDGRYGEGASVCSSADFDLTFSDTASGSDLSVADEANYCQIGSGANDRTSESVHPQPYLPNFPTLTGTPGLSGNPRTYESQGMAGNLLANFVGDDPLSGNWGLRVQDVYAQDVGTVQEACVDMDFGSVTYDMWVSSDPTCSDTTDTAAFNIGETAYVCYVVSNEATEDFLFQSETNNHGQTLTTDLAGPYSAKFGGTGTIRTAVRSFTAGADPQLPAGTTTSLTGSVTVVGSDLYFAAPETLTTSESVSITVAADIAPGDDTGTATSGAANAAAVA
ncbi:hypothetical protein, partial [Thalassorhabdomicrobium marinisediminis]|uniref:hypothetical protein n=1 Tax=Thalassorhabdomicrobium marinisediminis TaxID=2170577 RepID=UPI002491713B